MQRLLYQAKWDVDAVCADVGDYVAERLGEPDAVLVVDESGVPKKGTKSAGVAPRYCGARNTVVNCQVGVFVAYVSTRGTALVDRELYLPKGWTEDRERCPEAGIPEQVGVRMQAAARRQDAGQAGRPRPGRLGGRGCGVWARHLAAGLAGGPTAVAALKDQYSAGRAAVG